MFSCLCGLQTSNSSLLGPGDMPRNEHSRPDYTLGIYDLLALLVRVIFHDFPPACLIPSERHQIPL